MELLRTEGPWRDERDAAAAFDAAVDGDPRFGNVYHEVIGFYSSRSPFDLERTPRIDRILTPSAALVGAGWETGLIGVELKAPNLNAGPAVAQCLDYTRAAFEIRPGMFVYLGFVFLFPAKPEIGTVASLMAQHRVGTCLVGHDNYLRFMRDHTQVISIDEPKRNQIPRRKVGSR